MKNYTKKNIITLFVCFMAIMGAIINNQIQIAQINDRLKDIENNKSNIEILIVTDDTYTLNEFEDTPEPKFIPFYYISDSERETAEHIVEGEAEGESLYGKILVAQCIYNACVQDNLTPNEVKTQYQYSGWSENISEDSKLAVSKVFDYGEMGVDDNILWFYAPKYSNGGFHNTQRLVIEEGGHRFYAPWS